MGIIVKKNRYWHYLPIILTCLCPSAFATNGINLIGYGAESTLLGGSDIATISDTGALNTNPAGLTNIPQRQLDIYSSILRTTDLSHDDNLNNQHADNRFTLLNGGGYAQSLTIADTSCVWGVGLFVQGGAGGMYKHVKIPFGEGKMSSMFGIAKISPGIGCQVTDKLAIGISTSLIYADIEQKFFFHTSNPFFSGFENKGARAIKTGFKLGLQYQLNKSWRLGLAYTDKTALPLTNGDAKFNMTGNGLGVVKYKSVDIKGLALPREIAIGLGYSPNDRLQITGKVHWLNWNKAINNVVTTAKRPSNGLAPSKIVQVTDQDWHNQWVYALGAKYRYTDKVTLYTGFNHGKNPIPEKNGSPLLAGFLEDHLTLGFSYKLNNQWTLTSGIEYLFPADVEYDSPLFGNNTEARNEGFFLHFMLSKRW